MELKVEDVICPECYSNHNNEINVKLGTNQKIDIDDFKGTLKGQIVICFHCGNEWTL